MADRVIQGYFVTRQSSGQTLLVQAKPTAPRPSSARTTFAAGVPVAQPKVGDDSMQIDPVRLGLASGGGRPLPDAVRSKMEAAFSTDFSGVRVHIGPQAERIGALAFTIGTDIYFAPGRYQPDSIHGQQLIGHELAHVVQQRQGRVRGPSSGGIAIVQDHALEAEADRLAQRAATVQAKLAGYRPPITASQPNPFMSPMYRPQAAASQLKPQPNGAARRPGVGVAQRAISLWGALNYVNPVAWWNWYNGPAVGLGGMGVPAPAVGGGAAVAVAAPIVVPAPAPLVVPPSFVPHVAPARPAEFLNDDAYQAFLRRRGMHDTHESRAKFLEWRDQGHALLRHGPGTSDDIVRARLSQGTQRADGTWFETRVSGRFHNFEDYMVTRMAAVRETKKALAKTLELLTPELNSVAGNGGVWAAGDRISAMAKIANVIPRETDNFEYLPVKWDGTVNHVVLYRSYEVILNHNRNVGEGFRGDGARTQRIAHKNINVYLPQGHSILADIRGTRTSFNVPSRIKLIQIRNAQVVVERWRAGQHFPVNAGVSHIEATDYVPPAGHARNESPWL